MAVLGAGGSAPPLLFTQSHGSLTDAPHFQGKDRLLSGLADGQVAATGQNWIERADGSVEHLTSTVAIEMQVGDIFTIETPGSGGHGQPLVSG